MKLSNIIKSIKHELKIYINYIIQNYPDSAVGNRLRAKFYRKLLRTPDSPFVLSNVTIDHGYLMTVGEKLTIGKSVTIDAGNSDGIYIGDLVSIAHATYIRSGNHNIDDIQTPIKNQGHNCSHIKYNGTNYSIVIEDDVWIGASCLVLSGAHIGKGSVLSAGAVVSGYIPPYSIVVGNPGRVVLNRKSRANKGRHLKE